MQYFIPKMYKCIQFLTEFDAFLHKRTTMKETNFDTESGHLLLDSLDFEGVVKCPKPNTILNEKSSLLLICLYK